MLSDVCQSVCHTDCKSCSGWKHSGTQETLYCIKYEFQFLPLIQCGLRQITLASCFGWLHFESLLRQTNERLKTSETADLLWSWVESPIHVHSGSRSSTACVISFAFTVTLASLNVRGLRVVAPTYVGGELCRTQHTLGRSRDESFRAINFNGTNIRTHKWKTYTKLRKITPCPRGTQTCVQLLLLRWPWP